MGVIIKPQGKAVARVTIEMDNGGQMVSKFQRLDVVGMALHPLAVANMLNACMGSLIEAMMQPLKKESVSDGTNAQSNEPPE